MPTGCRTCEKQVPMQYTAGRKVVLPWCVEHGRWYMECQCRGMLAVLPDSVSPELPDGVVDFMKERAKRKGMEQC